MKRRQVATETRRCVGPFSRSCLYARRSASSQSQIAFPPRLSCKKRQKSITSRAYAATLLAARTPQLSSSRKNRFSAGS